MTTTSKRASKLTAAQMRVAIAKDVLVVLSLGSRSQYVVKKGTYCVPSRPPKRGSVGDLQEAIPKLGKCRVCARGAVFLSAVRLFNDQPLDGMPTVYGSSGAISLYDSTLSRSYRDFGGQITSIEAAFEGWDQTYYADSKWLSAYPDPIERLRAIMRNIILGKGTFDISKVEGWRVTAKTGTPLRVKHATGR